MKVFSGPVARNTVEEIMVAVIVRVMDKVDCLWKISFIWLGSTPRDDSSAFVLRLRDMK